MEESKNLEKNFDKMNEKLHISDVCDSDLVNQIKICKDEVIEDMEMCGYSMDNPLIESLVNLINLIERL